ncbi:secreted RxLR effector protein 161-like [Arachis hypogaea]|uniref:secreted RxLR effector protein 161-like n=1 Tax=Arachis hypogaea TaxID=3818 RepID=UPI003B213F16
MDYSIHLSKTSGDPYHDASVYRRLIGKLQYLTNTRLDIAFAVDKLSQYLDSPTVEHHKVAMRILHYLKNALATGLFFPLTTDFKLTGFADADWATCLDTRRSVSGYCFFLGTTLVSWKSTEQQIVSWSSSEAEYCTLANATCEGLWLLRLLEVLGVSHNDLFILYIASQSALHMAANSILHERTKHIEADCHIVQDKAHEGVLKLLPVTSANQTADLLTKTLAPGPFSSCFSKLGLLDIHTPSLRGEY